GSITNAGLLEATSGNSKIANVNDDLAGPEVFTNTGKILVTGNNTKLTLDTDVLTNTGGTVQIDDGSVPGTNDPLLELKSAENDDGSIINNGLLEATSGNNVIKNVNDDGSGPGGEVFTNTCTILVTGDSTKLTLDTDVLTNTNGTVQVDDGSVPGTNDPI